MSEVDKDCSCERTRERGRQRGGRPTLSFFLHVGEERGRINRLICDTRSHTTHTHTFHINTHTHTHTTQHQSFIWISIISSNSSISSSSSSSISGEDRRQRETDRERDGRWSKTICTVRQKTDWRGERQTGSNRQKRREEKKTDRP